ncbi:MAG: 3-deoxy-D-manno-octulosonic-acid transferase [Lysobacterales bacterium]|jgi:3-deoxy-D-manno-octulosonic-acid transferase
MISVVFYNIILVFILVAYIPHLFLRKKWHEGLWKQVGGDLNFLNKIEQGENVWIHAVSVGEVLAIEGFVCELAKKYPKYQIIVSTVTRTGQKLAKERLNGVAKVIYAPFDFSWVVRKYIKAINPKVYFAAETEIWPNLYRFLDKEGVPIIQLNGRISDSSYKGYKMIKLLVESVLNRVSLFCMQSPLDKERIEVLGADINKVHVLGNMKFDNLKDVKKLSRKEWGYSSKDIILVAGSTHPGEEEILIDTYKNLLKEYPSVRFILAPRHIERTKNLVDLIKSKGLNVVCLSQKDNFSSDEGTVLLVDTIGKLKQIYTLANIVFIGKTLIGRGGQNILEPAIAGKPIVVGPNMQNFKDILAIFRRNAALIEVEDSDDLLVKLKMLLNDEELREEYGVLAHNLIDQHTGATDKTLDAVEQYLN